MEENTVLIARAQSGDKRAREVLVENNLGLVHHIVKRFYGRGYDTEDLFQIGSIGLMKAIDKFDLSYDVKFSTYAVPMITGEIKRFLRDDGMIKMSRSLKENAWKIHAVSERLMHERGREVTIDEIAKELALSPEDIILSMEANMEVESIYKTVYQGEGTELYLVDKLPTKQDDNEHLLNRMMIDQLLETLEDKERKLITLRYYCDKTQVEVAKELGISQVQVSRLEKKVLRQMREELEV
ncbi:MAG: SigF/SigG family RNA polymerase sporulation sigma factor [Lachnospiraceae bacterium]